MRLYLNAASLLFTTCHPNHVPSPEGLNPILPNPEPLHRVQAGNQPTNMPQAPQENPFGANMLCPEGIIAIASYRLVRRKAQKYL